MNKVTANIVKIGPKLSRYGLSGVTIIGAIAISIVLILASARTQVSALAQAVFQVIILGLGLSGSYAFARERPPSSARSAFRRTLSLYQGLGRIAGNIEARRRIIEHNVKDGAVSVLHMEAALDIVEAQVIEQISTANDALEDWRDLAPAELAKLEEIEAERERRNE